LGENNETNSLILSIVVIEISKINQERNATSFSFSSCAKNSGFNNTEFICDSLQVENEIFRFKVITENINSLFSATFESRSSNDFSIAGIIIEWYLQIPTGKILSKILSMPWYLLQELLRKFYINFMPILIFLLSPLKMPFMHCRAYRLLRSQVLRSLSCLEFIFGISIQKKFVFFYYLGLLQWLLNYIINCSFYVTQTK